MSNMKFVYNGTFEYTFDVNPFPYTHEEISLESNERKIDAGLISYNNGIYHIFQLSFTNIGTAQMANFGTIYRSKNPITFLPYDEVRGTAESFNVKWTGNFSPKLSDGFWASGYSLDIILETT